MKLYTGLVDKMEAIVEAWRHNRAHICGMRDKVADADDDVRPIFDRIVLPWVAQLLQLSMNVREFDAKPPPRGGAFKESEGLSDEFGGL